MYNRILNTVTLIQVMLIVLGLLGFFASVNVWRGLWSVYDNYLFPHVDKEINYLTRNVGLDFLMWKHLYYLYYLFPH